LLIDEKDAIFYSRLFDEMRGKEQRMVDEIGLSSHASMGIQRFTALLKPLGT